MGSEMCIRDRYRRSSWNRGITTEVEAFAMALDWGEEISADMGIGKDGSKILNSKNDCGEGIRASNEVAEVALLGAQRSH